MINNGTRSKVNNKAKNEANKKARSRLGKCKKLINPYSYIS